MGDAWYIWVRRLGLEYGIGKGMDSRRLLGIGRDGRCLARDAFGRAWDLGWDLDD